MKSRAENVIKLLKSRAENVIFFCYFADFHYFCIQKCIVYEKTIDRTAKNMA